ncbi:MAG: replication-relaxation family protein [Phycisphaeraceae bacterium]|nr:replication-relaxation family protein [Phycisphaeraceae bacterium]
MRISPRDERLLCELFGHGVLTAEQTTRLGLFGSVVRARSRLLILVEGGPVRKRRAVPLGTSRALYSAGPKAAPTLARILGVDAEEASAACRRRLSPFLLEHSLAVAETRIALQGECARLGVSFDWTWERLCRHEYETLVAGGWERRIVRPDGLASIGGSLWFVEVDLGHVSLPRWRRRIEGYRRYLRDGAFAEGHGRDSFGVLVLASGELRLSRLARPVPQGSPRFLFARLQDLSSDAIPAFERDPASRFPLVEEAIRCSA